MNRTIRTVAGLLLIAAMGLTQNVSAAQTYKAYDLGVLPGEVYGEATAINQSGEIVGLSILSDDSEHPFVLRKDDVIDLGPFAGGENFANDINDHGQVVGWTEGVTDILGFLWEDGVITYLGTLGGNFSSGNGINNLGQIVGHAANPDDYIHAALWDNGVIVDLGTLGGNSSEAEDINEDGQIVGSSQTSNGFFYHAFLWDDGIMIDLGTLGGQQSFAYGINEDGQVVGTSQTSQGVFHAFLWQDGVMTDLGASNVQSIARAINDLGQVVGEVATSQYDTAAFLWENGVMTTLEGRGRAWDINNKGEIVGHTSFGPTLWYK